MTPVASFWKRGLSSANLEEMLATALLALAISPERSSNIEARLAKLEDEASAMLVLLPGPTKEGSLANEKQCSYSSECQSRRCYRPKDCDSETKSNFGDCPQVCAAKQSTYGKCSKHEDCDSGVCGMGADYPATKYWQCCGTVWWKKGVVGQTPYCKEQLYTRKVGERCYISEHCKQPMACSSWNNKCYRY